MSNKPIIRDAVPGDIRTLTDLHARNFHANELSIILGKLFIEKFYTLALSSENVIIKVIESSGKLAALSMIFLKYSEFEKRYKRISFLPLVLKILRDVFSLRLKQVRHLVKAITGKKAGEILPADIYDFHVGAFIIAEEFRYEPAIVVLFYHMYKENVEYLKSQGKAGCWGVCRETNNPSYRLLKDRSLSKEIDVASYPENIKVLIFMKGQEEKKQ